MRILILNPILFTHEKFVLPKVRSIKDTMIHTMCMGFRSLGHEVTLAAAADYRPSEPEEYDFDVRFFPTQGPRMLACVLPFSVGMLRFIRRNARDYDLVVCSEAFGLHTLWAAWSAPRRTVIWQELSAHQKMLHRVPARLWYNVVARLFMRRCAVAARSVAARDFIARYLPQVSPVIVEHGIDIDRFDVSPVKKNQFVVVAQLIARKNVATTIRKFAAYVRRYDSSCRLVICGRGPELEHLRDVARREGVDDNVIFAGFLPHSELGRIVSESLALLTDTLQDANMVSIPEAVASGTPVISNTVPTSDLMDAHGAGIKRDDWDEHDMHRVATDKSYIQACLNVRRQLSAAHQAQLLIDIIKSDP